MRDKDVLRYAMTNVKGRKLRTWLTVIGIIIGIMTIVSIVSIGEGIKKDITDQLESFGSDKITIIPMSIDEGFSSGSFTSAPNAGKLFEEDLETVEKIAGVKSVAKAVYGRMSVGFKETEITAVVYGVTTPMFDQYSDLYEIEEGRYFRDGEDKVAVLGNTAANDFFGNDKIKVGNSIFINGEKYRVVGVLKEIGSSLSQTDDSAIYVPFDDGSEQLENILAKDELQMISVEIEEGFDANELKDEIEQKIAINHKVRFDDLDFSVLTADVINETIGGIISTLELFLVLIAGIASIVSGVGIMNTMFMNIIEKTKEIGVLKAVGATQIDIMKIFLLESAMIGGFGGIIGILGGFAVSELVKLFGILSVITPELFIGAFLFAVSIGIGAGFIPARRAAMMNIVVAMRK